ncbi:Putative HC-toxin efflux carrier TOXA [Cytospora mali]|uniref:HC-toxin efflux carrier TOXA n=1 Tax=Cytospora mali TaxID=578113 RepID=A0A194VMN3_CYTMA|nr:Putative HC-toxin efflux carrier TOXA [Valsa mali]
MAAGVENNRSTQVLKSEQNTLVDGRAGASTPTQIQEKHPRDGMPEWKWATTKLVICSLSLIYGYDIGNVANIQADIYKAFGNIDILPWVALAFPTANMACIPLARRLTGIFDLRLILSGSVIVFFVGAAICATSRDMNALIAGRVVNGIGACGVYQCSLSYSTAFASPVEVAKIMGLIGMCYSLGLIGGPVIGGAFAQNIHATWRWAFYINLPIAGACLLAVVFLMPSYKAPSILSVTQRLWKSDLIGCVLHAAAVVLLNVALTLSGAVWRWTSGSAIAAWVVCGLVWAIYLAQQAFCLGTTPEHRAFPVHLLTHRTVGLLFLTTCMIAVCHGVALYYLPLFYAFAEGYGSLTTAVHLLPYICVFIFSSILAGILLPKLGRYNILFLTAGAAALIGGALLAHQVAITTSVSHVMGFEAIIAFGVGLGLTHGMSVANTVLPREHRFDAAALMNMAQIGSIAVILGVAGCIFQNVGMDLLRDTVTTYEARTGADLNLTSHDLRQALGGVASPLWESGDAEIEYLAVGAVTRTITRIFNIILAAGGVCIAGALLMRWEKLEFKPVASKVEIKTEV